MICVLAGGKTATFAAAAFTLAWTHSVEKTLWQERWAAGPDGLTAIEGRVEGSGAGMEPPPDAVLEGGAYVYRPTLAPIPELVLAASGATGGGWTFCAQGGPCRVLGAERGDPVRIRSCDAPAPPEKDGPRPSRSR